MPLFGLSGSGKKDRRTRLATLTEPQVSEPTQLGVINTFQQASFDPLDVLLDAPPTFQVVEGESSLSEEIESPAPTPAPDSPIAPPPAVVEPQQPEGPRTEVTGDGRTVCGQSGLNGQTNPREDQQAAVVAWQDILTANSTLFEGRVFGESRFYGHPQGMAVDVLLSEVPGVIPTEENHRKAVALARWACANQGPGRPFDLVLYRNGDPGAIGITAAHYDHVHISFSVEWRGAYPQPPRLQ